MTSLSEDGAEVTSEAMEAESEVSTKTRKRGQLEEDENKQTAAHDSNTESKSSKKKKTTKRKEAASEANAQTVASEKLTNGDATNSVKLKKSKKQKLEK